MVSRSERISSSREEKTERFALLLHTMEPWRWKWKRGLMRVVRHLCRRAAAGRELGLGPRLPRSRRFRFDAAPVDPRPSHRPPALALQGVSLLRSPSSHSSSPGSSLTLAAPAPRGSCSHGLPRWKEGRGQ
jgi:hypothetical protein